jgi:hypothetical protein
MKKFSLLFLSLILAFMVFSQQKKPLDNSVYDHWKNLRNAVLSDDGNYISYEINPQQGDGWLYLYNVRKAVPDSLPRGQRPGFWF